MQHFDYQIIFGVKCNSKWGLGTTWYPPWYPPVKNVILGDFSKFVILLKMQGENANKIYHVYKAVVLHICNRILGIPSPEYPGNKNQILMLIKV